MTDSKASKTCSEIRDLIMPYLEDLLTAEERSELEEHMRNCNNCAEELADKRRWSSILEVNRGALCPEPWELFEHAHDPNKVSSSLNVHLQSCASCREHYEAFLKSSPEQSMPGKLWERITNTSEAPTIIPKPHIGLSERLDYLTNRIRDFFSVQVLAFASVAAAILLVVLLYPLGPPQSVAVLSSQDWRSVVIKRDLMGSGVPQQGRKRLAELVIIKDKGDLPQQAWIDSLYSELEPSEKSIEAFDWITPAELSNTVAGKQLNISDRKTMVSELHSKLHLTEALLITITSGKADGTYDVDVELVKAETGDTLGKERLTNIQEKNLGTKVKIAIRSLLKVD